MTLSLLHDISVITFCEICMGSLDNIGFSDAEPLRKRVRRDGRFHRLQNEEKHAELNINLSIIHLSAWKHLLPKSMSAFTLYDTYL